MVNAVDVLTAVQNEFKTRRDLLKSQYDFITNLFLLNRWAGELNQDSVDSVNVWLSPVPETSLPGGAAQGDSEATGQARAVTRAGASQVR